MNGKLPPPQPVANRQSTISNHNRPICNQQAQSPIRNQPNPQSASAIANLQSTKSAISHRGSPIRNQPNPQSAIAIRHSAINQIRNQQSATPICNQPNPQSAIAVRQSAINQIRNQPSATPIRNQTNQQSAVRDPNLQSKSAISNLNRQSAITKSAINNRQSPILYASLCRRIDGSVDADPRVEGKVIIEQGAIVERSVIRGPVIIGAGARIVSAFVGPFTSIMSGAEVRDSEIEHGIVLEGRGISNLAARIEDSLIGKNVRSYRLPVKPSAYRFMLGDKSEVGIRS